MDSFWTLSGVLGLFRVSGEPEVTMVLDSRASYKGWEYSEQ
jgi:hypothetical protein